MKAKSIKGKSTADMKTTLEERMATRYKLTVAIVFSSIEQDRKELAEHSWRVL